MTIAAIGLSLFGSGCADKAEDHYDRSPLLIRVETPELLEAAKEAAAEWRACGSREVWIAGIEGVPTYFVPAKDQVLVGVTVVVDWEIKSITLRDDIGPKNYRATLAHEIGHAILLTGDHPGKTGIMNDGIVKANDHVTEEDCGFLRERMGGEPLTLP